MILMQQPGHVPALRRPLLSSLCTDSWLRNAHFERSEKQNGKRGVVSDGLAIRGVDQLIDSDLLQVLPIPVAIMYNFRLPSATMQCFPSSHGSHYQLATVFVDHASFQCHEKQKKVLFYAKPMAGSIRPAVLDSAPKRPPA